MRSAFTLLEVLVAVGLTTVVFGAFWAAFGSGVSGFYRGTSHVTALQDALVLLERLEQDIDVMATPPSLLATPVQIGADGSSLRFAVPHFDGDPTDQPFLRPVTTVWVEYGLVKDDDRPGIFHPRRGDTVYGNVDVRPWTFEVDRGVGSTDGTTPMADPASVMEPSGMQFLVYRLEVEGVFGRKPFTIARRKELVAATMAARYGAEYPLAVRLVADPVEPSALTTATGANASLQTSAPADGPAPTPSPAPEGGRQTSFGVVSTTQDGGPPATVPVLTSTLGGGS